MRFAKKNNKQIVDFGVSHTPETKNLSTQNSASYNLRNILALRGF